MYKILIAAIAILSIASCNQAKKNGQNELLSATEFSRKISETAKIPWSP